MKFPASLDLKPANLFKIAAVIFLAVILLTFAYRMIGSTLTPIFRGGPLSTIMAPGMPAFESAQSDRDGSSSYGEGIMPQLSIRNISPIPPQGGAGSDLEAYEVTTHSAYIETGDLKRTCASIADLKSRDYVIFESANTYDRGCSFVFKVERERAEEILTAIKSYDPKEISANTQTIKRIVDDFTSETEILEKKKETIEKTLLDATRAYEEITALAARAQDVETLAKIIDSKIRIIERLTQEQINVNEQLDRLSRAKADQLDRLDYTYFSVSVVENKFVDGENLKDSWKAAVKQFVRDINQIAQEISIGLVALLFVVLQYGLYLVLLLVVAKYGWKFAQYLWKK